MKKLPITFIILTVALTLLMVSAPGYAAVTDKVILKIEGMT